MGIRLFRNWLPVACVAVAAGCCCLAGCGTHGGPSKTEQAYFDTYSNETRRTIAWWKQQVDTAQLVRAARGAASSTGAAIGRDAAAKHDEALQTLRHEYGLTSEEIQAVANGQMTRKIEEELARGRKKLEVRIDRLEKIFSQTCKDFEKNPKGTVDELRRAENNLEEYLKGG